MSKVIGRTFSTDIDSKVDGENYWTVSAKITEVNTYEDGTTDTESIEAKCIDRDAVMANQIALQAALVQFRQEVYDRGATSLIEARKKFGNSYDNSSNNKDTLTQ